MGTCTTSTSRRAQHRPAGSGYVGKPRPVVIVQDDRFDATGSFTIGTMTTDPTDAPLFRVAITPDPSNQLRETSRLMVDKLTAVPRSKLGERFGGLDDEDMIRRAILVFLGRAGPSDTSTR